MTTGLRRAFRTRGAPTILIAPTERQAKDRWMGEPRKWVGRMHPDLRRFFHAGASRVVIMGNRDWCVRYSLASKPENVQGEHAVGQTILLDEASGIPREIIETVLGTQTDPDCLTGFFGNPNTRDCGFFDCFNRDRVRWTNLTWNAEDSERVSKANIERIAATYGRNSDVFKVRVLGEFPSQDPQSVMSADDCEACTKNDMVAASRINAQKQLGLDLARFGNDECVTYRRSGLAIVEERITYGLEIDSSILAAFQMQENAGWRDDKVWYVADADGLSQGAMHLFRRRRKQLHEFHFGGAGEQQPDLRRPHH